MSVYGQRPDGSWAPAEPLGPQGRIARLEFWLRDRGHHRLARILGEIDEFPLRFGR